MGIALSKCCSFIFTNSEDSDYHNREHKQSLLKQQQDNYLYQQQMSLQKEEQEKIKQMKRQQKLLEKETLLTDIVNVANDSYLDVGIIENIENIMISNEVLTENTDFSNTNKLEKENLLGENGDDRKLNISLVDKIALQFKNKSVTKGISLFDNDYEKFLENNPSILLKDPKITAEMFSNKLDVYKHLNNRMRSKLMQLHDKEFNQFAKLVQENFSKIENKKNQGEISSLVLKR
ncbi:hypothetical protein HANVADRAFT_47017 [Hanseniaspora valbyensis NRRL Y-1626]|uniref:Uncharacterized protein n=1 Tax=Hanseniaspora valbyensis NRRL Y-1626 TaxID=766949 RepID=A0A1B7TJB6_9ASCO|nr:hypothetical protein HANVADRAFT_47017 [Hanseniaspora valbyensis NRRL Y-1626]